MSLTAIDPRTALIVVDLQRGIVTLPSLPAIESVVVLACTLTDVFRAHGLPVVLVNVLGRAPGRTEQPQRDVPLSADWAELIPELHAHPNDILITKRSWGAFATTDLEQRLRALGVTQVVIAGVATGTGVEATARQAYELGFNVTLAIDAMTDTRPEAHAHSIASVFPRLGERGSTQAIINLLNARGS